MNWLEQKFVYLVGGRCRNFKRISETVFNFSCPLCGDSQKHLRKARGYITEKNGHVRYTCHKCGAHMPLYQFIQAVDLGMYADYQKERVVAGFWKATADRRVTNPFPATQDPKPVAEHNRNQSVSDHPLSPLLRVDTLKPDHVAREFCEKRKLPDFTRLYHCPKFYAWTNWVLKTEKFPKKALYYDHPRLVIPFFVGGVMTAFQGRDYDPKSDNKYITIRVDESAPKVFGLDDLNPTETVYALEGPINSMFLPNACAFAGGNHSILTELEFDKDKTVVVYDNEPRSAHTRKKIAHAIRDGYGVCIWPRHVIQNDVNDMVRDGLDPKAIIDSRTFSGLQAELELSIW